MTADIEMQVGLVKSVAFRTENRGEPLARAGVDRLQKPAFLRILAPVLFDRNKGAVAQPKP